MSKLFVKGIYTDDSPFVMRVTSPDADEGYEILPSPDDLNLELDSAVEWTVVGRNLRDRTPEVVMLVLPASKIPTHVGGQPVVEALLNLPDATPPTDMTARLNLLMEKT